MGQYKIYEFLKENDGVWFSARDLSDVFGVRCSSVSRAFNSLFKFGLVERDFISLSNVPSMVVRFKK